MVDVDDEDYRSRVEGLKYSVIGRLSLQRGQPISKTMELKTKLAEFKKFYKFKVIPLGKVMFYILLYNLKDQFKALSIGTLLFKPGLLQLNRWVPGFSATSQVQSIT